MFLGARLPHTTYLYEDPEHPARVTRTIGGPAYTRDDRTLLMALAHIEEQQHQCRCGEPIEVAWHSEMDGWYERRAIVCHACTALQEPPSDGAARKPVTHAHVINTRPASRGPLPPFVLGVTTTAG